MYLNMNNQFWGRMGEAEVRDLLVSKGHQILELNWRSGHLEVDLISVCEGCCYFSEVKTRFIKRTALLNWQQQIHGLLDKQFNLKKQSNLRLAVQRFRKINPQYKRIQIDFFSVIYISYGKNIYHFKHPISCF